MTIRPSPWHATLLALAVALMASTPPASAFSGRGNGKRTSFGPKRGSGSFASTRRVFCFTLAGGAHNMFSGMRTGARKRPRPMPSATSATELRYRAADDGWDCGGYESAGEGYGAYTDSLWRAALEPARGDAHELGEATHTREMMQPGASSSKDDGLVETAKAFLPVAVEIGVVAAVAARHLN